ncbi:hypothetical protein OIE69_42710 [Actinacidiphila glaucinigra]|uniref:hypothetical protein n=1 Tax=Actinacidiphila glaucinigra TaxID=235986 RepID=UPI002DDAA42D|nr:hypothetical protein [Actinacidiphila glaucinigra]WSD65106.1 hypothetical protein OIE69_42710 [Actinacidiphila glaucinigra]
MSEGIAGLRLLPWTDPAGKPAYTPDGNPAGLIAQMADDVERQQITRASAVLSDVVELLRTTKDAPRLINEPSRIVLTAACEALANVLRVAVSRGMRLPGYDRDEIPESEWTWPPRSSPSGDGPAESGSG